MPDELLVELLHIVAGEAQNGFRQATSAPSVFNQAMPFIAIPPSAITGPTTTLNIGMDYMGGPVTPVPTIRGKATPASPPANMHPTTNAGSRDVSQPDLWLQVITLFFQGIHFASIILVLHFHFSENQDARELKRERRKQSNRESARRSRLRKQVKC